MSIVGTIDGFFDFWRRVFKKFTVLDIKLLQVYTATLALILAKAFPAILVVPYGLLIAIAVVSVVRFAYLVGSTEYTASSDEEPDVAELADKLRTMLAEQETRDERIADLVLMVDALSAPQETAVEAIGPQRSDAVETVAPERT